MSHIPTQKDADQVLRYSFDDDTNSLRVEGTFSSTNAANGTPGTTPPSEATQVAGVDTNGNLHVLQTDASGNLFVSLASEPGAPFHVIVDSSALPTGASTSANQATSNTSLNTIISNQTNGTQETQIVGTVPLPIGAATAANQTTQETTLSAIQANQTNGTQTTGITGTVPLPTGAATAANQTSQITQETATATSTASIDSKTVHVDTGSVTIVSSSLPTGASTSANQTNASQKTQIVDGSGNVIASTSNALNVQVENFPATQPVSGTVTVTQATGTNLHTVVDSSALPTGAATSANQTNGTQQTQLVQGGNTAAVSAAGAVKVDASATTQPVSGSVTVTQATGTNLHTVVDSSALPTGASTSALQTSVQGSATGGTAATSSSLDGGIFNTTLPTLTNGQQAALQLNTSGKLLTQSSIQPTNGTLTDNSGTTSATPSTSTTIMASNASRKYLLIQNVSTTNTIWVNFTTSATTTQPSYELLPGGSLVQEAGFVSTEAVTVICTAASSPYTAKQA